MFEISQMLFRKCQQTFPGFWVAGGQFRPFGPPSTIRATTYARHRSTGASGSRVDDCFRRILVVAACCGKGPFQRSFADLHRRALPKNWSLLRAGPGKPREGKTSRMLPAFCRGSRGVTRRHKGVALPAILHAPCLGAFLKQALEYVLTRIVSGFLASVSYFTHARSARLYGPTESKAAPGRMPDKCCQRTGPLRPADRRCARRTRGASACGRLHRRWTRRRHGLPL